VTDDSSSDDVEIGNRNINVSFSAAGISCVLHFHCLTESVNVINYKLESTGYSALPSPLRPVRQTHTA